MFKWRFDSAVIGEPVQHHVKGAQDLVKTPCDFKKLCLLFDVPRRILLPHLSLKLTPSLQLTVKPRYCNGFKES
jgi:hypothetical protein